MKYVLVFLMMFSLVSTCFEDLEKLVPLEGCTITKAAERDVDSYAVVLTKDNKEYGIIKRNDATFKFWWEQDAGVSETITT